MLWVVGGLAVVAFAWWVTVRAASLADDALEGES